MYFSCVKKAAINLERLFRPQQPYKSKCSKRTQSKNKMKVHSFKITKLIFSHLMGRPL